MRSRLALFAVLFLALFATTVAVVGQEEPLPQLTARPDAPSDVMLVALATEPIHASTEPTLLDAARANDYATFEAIYKESKERGALVAQYDAFYELWTYSITDPIGAFYGEDLHARIARAYPGFATYIDDYKIVDNHGNVFYPTSETREFLLARALEGRSAPRVLIADAREEAPVETRDTTPATEPRATSKTKPAPVAIAAKTSAPAPVAQQTAVEPAPVAQPVAIAAAAPVAEVPVATPVVAQVATTQPVAAAPVVAASMVPSQQNDSAKPADAASRGILLIILGIIGFGMLALMLRAPKEIAPQTIDVKAQPSTSDVKDAATVEPLRRPAAQQQNEPEKHRANGSRG